MDYYNGMRDRWNQSNNRSAYNGNRGNYNGNRGGYNSNQNQRPQYKKSAAKYSQIRNGRFEGLTIVNAYNVSKSKGLIKATVAPYKGSLKGDKVQIVESVNDKTGQIKEYIKMIAVVKYERSGVEKVIPCLMNMKTRVIVLDDLQMVITPNGTGQTRRGKTVTGYFGKYTRS
ncbi:hypothetical protein [Zhouia amylolytica]|uniref:hypothetical protein n=1 Tax=Zhouia amylolytica TaxID=376730 RepID=UPI0020CEEFD9|nr:hypothetical protein [Zhouia amylolytica]MCQ0113034.1 hypothetical protein [Zhouia amylolytica]